MFIVREQDEIRLSGWFRSGKVTNVKRNKNVRGSKPRVQAGHQSRDGE